MATYANVPAQQGSKNAAMTSLTTANLKLVATDITGAGKIVTSTYQYVGSDPTDPTSVIVRRETTNSGTRMSIRLITKVEDTDPVTTDPVAYQYEVGMFINLGSEVFTDLAKQSVMVQLVATLLLAAYDGSTGVPAATNLNLLNFGVTQLW